MAGLAGSQERLFKIKLFSTEPFIRLGFLVLRVAATENPKDSNTISRSEIIAKMPKTEF